MLATSKEFPILKAGSQTNIASLKTAIVQKLINNGAVYVDAIGMQANYVVLKAVIKARGEMLVFGKDIGITPVLVDLRVIDTGEEKTAVRWILQIKPGMS